MSDDFSELLQLSADLTHAPSIVNRNVLKALKFTSVEIKKDWREGAEISGGYPETYPESIDFDINFPGGAIESEIGPTLGKTPGSSAGFLDEPLSDGGVDGPVHHAGRNALEANEDDFYRGLEIAVFDATAEAVEK